MSDLNQPIQRLVPVSVKSRGPAIRFELINGDTLTLDVTQVEFAMLVDEHDEPLVLQGGSRGYAVQGGKLTLRVEKRR